MPNPQADPPPALAAAARRAGGGAGRLAALAALAIWAACRPAPPPPPTPSAPRGRAMPVATAEVDKDGPPFVAVGRITYDENRTQHVGTPVDGRVTRLQAQLGDRVRRGQVLVTLRAPAVAALHGELRKARQDVNLAAREVQRFELLHADGATSERELMTARGELVKARAEQDQLEATVANLGLKTEAGGLEVNLVARVDGTVVERRVLVGQEVRADEDQLLMVISDLTRVWAIADLYETDLGVAAVGRRVQVLPSGAAAEPLAGQVAYVGDVVDAASRTVKVRCEVPNPLGRLKPEMFVQVAIDTPPLPGVWVPAAAVVMRGDEAAVWVTGPQGPARREVRCGRVVGERQQVTAGLAPGEQVISEGALFVERAQAP